MGTTRASLLIAFVFCSASCFSINKPSEYHCSDEEPACPSGLNCNGVMCVASSSPDGSIQDAVTQDVSAFKDAKTLDQKTNDSVVSSTDATTTHDTMLPQDQGVDNPILPPDGGTPVILVFDNGEIKANSIPGANGETFTSGGWIEANVTGGYSNAASHSAPLSLNLSGDKLGILTRSFSPVSRAHLDVWINIVKNELESTGCGTGGGPYIEIKNVGKGSSVRLGHQVSNPSHWSYAVDGQAWAQCGSVIAQTNLWFRLRIQFINGAASFFINEQLACTANSSETTVDLMHLRVDSGSCGTFNLYFDDVRLWTN